MSKHQCIRRLTVSVFSRQEENYRRITVDIELGSTEEIIQCQTFEFGDLYMMEASDDRVKYEILPSLTYLKVIVKGAGESNLPKEYIDFLKTINHNGKIAEAREKLLNLDSFHL